MTATDVDFLAAAYDFSELLGWKNQLRTTSLVPGTVSIDIDDASNVLSIVVIDIQAEQQVRALTSSLGIPAAAVRVSQGLPTERYLTLQDQFRPTKGGIQIKRGAGGYCTEGFVVVHDGYGGKGFITNSHCTNTQGGNESTPFYQNGTAWFGADFVGTEYVDPAYSSSGCSAGYTCRQSDAAYVHFDNTSKGAYARVATPNTACNGTSYCGLTVSGSQQELPVGGEWSSFYVGLEIDKIGRTSGWTYGALSNTCIDVIQSGSTFIITCQVQVSAVSGPGDSGSPVFVFNYTDVRAAGLLWGGDGTTFTFSPLSNIRAELGYVHVY